MKPRLVPHGSGALWLPEHQTLLAADLHLGYGFAQRRRGELGPVAEGGVAARLREAIAEFDPRRVVLLGDVYHAARPSEAERRMIASALAAVTSELVIVRGNHDRAILRDLRLAPVEEWRAPGVLAVHGDTMPETDGYLIVGHFHPVVKLSDAAGVKRRYPVFVIGERICVLPAMSPYSSGMPWRDLPFDTGGRPALVAATGKRAVRLGEKPPPVRQSPPSSPPSAG
jgi:metallophosphoesterase superfamily enzyme